MIEFKPIEGVTYRYDYASIFRDVACGTLPEIGTYRALILSDLFFIIYFVMKIPTANHKFVVSACREVEEGVKDKTLDLWAREHFKMLRLDEPVPTPTGWKKHGELKKGDELFGADGVICHVVAVNKIIEDAECFEIKFDDGTTIQAGAEHLWPVMKRSRTRIPKTYKTRLSHGKRINREVVLIKTSEIAKWEHKPDNRLCLNVNKPLDLKDIDLPIDPYLLGAWLGDGTSSEPAITGEDIEIFDEIERRGYILGKAQRKKESNTYTRRILKAAKIFKGIGVIGNKHIPPLYLRASITQRLDLLRGLMDTDGSCNPRGTATFCNINERLINDVYELATTLGLRPMKRRHLGKFNNIDYPFFNVSFQAYQDPCPFFLPRKVARCKKGERKNNYHFIVSCRRIPSVPMRCIQVDNKDGLYLAGRSMWPTHNSTVITTAEVVQKILKNPDERIAIFSHTRPIAKGFLRSIKLMFEGSEILKKCFPDILYENPQQESAKWSEDDGLIVKRAGYPKESTLEAWGLLEGMPTSKHFTHRIYDDIETADVVENPDTVTKLINRYNLSQNLGMEGGTHRVVGTTYSHQGILEYLKKKTDINGRNIYQVRVKPATVDGTPNGEPVLLSKEKLDELRSDEYTFNCHAAGTKILLNDFSEKNIEDIKEGDVVIGFIKSGRRTRLKFSIVEKIFRRKAETNKYVFESGRSTCCTPDHKWWIGRWKSGEDNRIEYATLEDIGQNKQRRPGLIRMFHAIPDIPNDAEIIKACAYLGGIFDGEGSFSANTIRIFQSKKHNPGVCKKITEQLKIAGFNFAESEIGRKVCTEWRLLGGRYETLKFLKWCEIAKWRDTIFEKCCLSSKNGTSKRKDFVISKKSVGKIDVYGIQTATGNYIANGYASKNCQQLLNPTPVGIRPLNSALLNEIDAAFIPEDVFKFMIVDPAGDSQDGKGDAWAMEVWGVEPSTDNIGASRVFLIDALISPLKETEAIEEIVRMYVRNGILAQIGIEKVGLSSVETHVANALAKQGRHISRDNDSLVLLSPAGRKKTRRIEAALAWPLYNGKIFISRDVKKIYRERFTAEMDKFPFWHDDGIDAASYLYDMIQDYKFAYMAKHKAVPQYEPDSINTGY